MRRIRTADDIAEGLDALCRIDARLHAVRERAGPVPLRRIEPGFRSLCSIIVGQQVSTASAAAIFSRFDALLRPISPETVSAASDALFREAGFSGAKTRTVRAAAEAIRLGLDLGALVEVEAETAVRRLTAVPGIGPWTAELYLLFAGGHSDIFPGRDIALQSAVGAAFGLTPRPGEKALALIAGPWSPWRGVAARLFWAYYRALRGREGVVDSRNLA